MGRKAQSSDTDRAKWEKILNALVHMIKTQQTQIEFLTKEKYLLENRIKRQCARSDSDVRLYNDIISQIKRDFVTQDLVHQLEVAKADTILGLKQRDAFSYKQKLEHAGSELADFRLWFDYLCHKCANAEEMPQDIRSNQRAKNCGKDGDLDCVSTADQEEVNGLPRNYEKLSSESGDKITALLSERNFAWKQYHNLETEYASKLNRKEAEMEQQKEKIQKLLEDMEDLQSRDNAKDETIVMLEAKVAALETEKDKKKTEIEQEKEKLEKLLEDMEDLQSRHNAKDETIVMLEAKVAALETEKDKSNDEIFRLSKELDLSKESHLVTPVLNYCTSGRRDSKTRNKSGLDSKNLAVKKDVVDSRINKNSNHSKKDCLSSKRKEAHTHSKSETPKLFSSAFKVPKLKNSPR